MGLLSLKDLGWLLSGPAVSLTFGKTTVLLRLGTQIGEKFGPLGLGLTQDRYKKLIKLLQNE